MTLGSEKEYLIPFFREKGYVRRRCPICGEYYWSLGRDNCGEAPCAPYSFIGRRVTKRSFTLDEMRRAFLSFFEKEGHTVIQPYPVVARWRDDIYLTIASIAVFQPFVTSGEVPPPANPLVISQPCIRLQDLDMVGLTGGRHLSIFEMGGHHAFNYPDKWVYWKDETVRLFHRFATEVLGIPEEEITYKEGVWEGGGNAGPDFEPIAFGLEIATLVFMKYRVEDGRYVELPLKIVDTGYGIERLTWLSQGTPSAFHAVYGDLLQNLFRRSGIGRVDEDLLAEHSRASALTLPPNRLSPIEVKRRVAAKLGLNEGEVVELLSRVEAAYTLLDHTKTIVFMLGDGLVPSNSGGGYLSRMMVRRAIRYLDYLGSPFTLEELLELQIRLWSKTFRKLRKRRDLILDMARVEVERYRAVERGARDKVLAVIRRQGGVSAEKLVELYDSHGITPELAASIARQHGVEVEVPHDFYSMIVKRHQSGLRRPEAGKKALRLEYPPTHPMYYDDPYATRFTARVVGVTGDGGVVLDRTLFYPEGGGQLWDTGVLRAGEEVYRVERVYKTGNGVVVHIVRPRPPKDLVGRSVVGEIDWDRRIALMRHHTATHILLAAARRLLGDHVWQAGARKEVEKARLDITHYKPLSDGDVEELEREANRIVMANLRVLSRPMERVEAERRYGPDLYQGGVVPGRVIRVVSIDNINHQACGGTHVRRTGEVGQIKILNVSRIQDGVVRLEFVAGEQALRKFQEVSRTLREVAELMGAQVPRIRETARNVVQLLKSQRAEIERLRVRVAELMAKGLIERGVKVGPLRLVSDIIDGDEELAIKVGEYVVSQCSNCVSVIGVRGRAARIVVHVGEDAVRRGLDAGEIVKSIARHIGGGGGGKRWFAQGGGPRPEGLEEAIKEAEELVRRVAR